MRTEAVRLDRITQRDEEENVLLDSISLQIFKGEIMGLICINSYGLDQLLNLIRQNVPIHYGYVYFDENLVNSYLRSSMKPNRVALIQQKSALVDSLTVADNIFVMRSGFKKFIIQPHVLERQFMRFVKGLGFSFSADTQVAQLSTFEKCVVEIIKAAATGSRLVILQDVSNFVGANDLQKLHALIRHFASEQMTFLYICSHHEEVFTICDRVAIMENGKVQKVLDKENFSDELMHDFIGIDFKVPHAGAEQASAVKKPVLSFEHIATGNLHDFNLTIYEGECAVLFDISNTVLSDLTGLFFGDVSADNGRIIIDGRPWKKANGKNSHNPQIAFIAEKPLQSMLFPDFSYIDNLCFTTGKLPMMWLNNRVRNSIIAEYEPRIGADIYAEDIRSLSPFSLYSLVYYRVHLCRPKVAICVQPFAGADMRLRYHVIGLIQELQRRGIAVLILAVSLSDSLSAADRLFTIERGHLSREYRSEEFNRGSDEFEIFQTNTP